MSHLLEDKIKDYIFSKTVTENKRKIGIELESLVFSKDFNRIPVNYCDEYSASELLAELQDLSDEKIGTFSLEPGGQIEWASPPCLDLDTLNNALNNYKFFFKNFLNNRGLKNLQLGVDPFNNPENIDLINKKKYQLMDKNMSKSGNLGKWMMRNTASIQINFDIVNQKDASEMLFIADCIHPVSAYLFSNSPFKLNSPVGKNNIRNQIWHQTDNSRCKSLFDHNINTLNNIIDDYIVFLKNVPGIFKFDNNRNIESLDTTIGKYLKNKFINNGLEWVDLESGLHQIFTNVRLKQFVEIRDIDCLPFKHIMSPVAFHYGIINNKNIRGILIEEFLQWSKKDREKWNKCGLTLDLNQMGPKNKTYYEWVLLVGELAIEGLKKKGLKDELYFSQFFYDILDKGPLTVQLQNQFLNYHNDVKSFIFKD